MANRFDVWFTNLNSLKAFVASHARYPSTTSNDKNERALASWWSRQKHLVKQGTKGDEQLLNERQIASVKEVTDQNPNLERDGVWESRYQALSEQYQTHRKLFSSTSSNIEEVKIMRWWNQQKTFARKFLNNPEHCGGMTQDRFDKVMALLNTMDKELSATQEPVANNS